MTKNNKSNNIEIAIIGGSGFYDFIRNGKEVEIETEWGKPSDKIVVGEVEGKQVAFLPRHGKNHDFPPHMVPYQANIAALKKIGVKYPKWFILNFHQLFMDYLS